MHGSVSSTRLQRAFRNKGFFSPIPEKPDFTYFRSVVILTKLFSFLAYFESVRRPQSYLSIRHTVLYPAVRVLSDCSRSGAHRITASGDFFPCDIPPQGQESG